MLLTTDHTGSAGQSDLSLRSQLTAANGPLFSGADITSLFSDQSQAALASVRAELTAIEQQSPETLSDTEREAIDRLRATLQQVAWTLLTSAEFRFNH